MTYLMGNDRSPDWLTESNWRPKYTDILTLSLERKSKQAIAEELGICVNTVARVQKSHLFEKRLAIIRHKTQLKITTVIAFGNTVEAARKIINEAAKDAALKMVELAENGGGNKIQFAACKDILDRSGLKPIEIVETREKVFSPDEVIHAKGVLEESQAIITRLTNQPSPFIRNVITALDVQASSATDQGSNGAKPTAPAEPPVSSS